MNFEMKSSPLWKQNKNLCQNMKIKSGSDLYFWWI